MRRRPFWWLREGGAGSGNFGHAGRPGEVGGSTPSPAGAAARDTLHNQGASVNTTGGRPQHGFMVALPGYEEVHPKITSLPKLRQAISNYIAKHASTLKGRYIGTWLENGTLYLDISENVTDRSRAVSLGHERDQIAVWDIDNNKSVYMMSDQKKPSESSGEPIRESESKPTSRLFFDPQVASVDDIAQAVWEKRK